MRPERAAIKRKQKDAFAAITAAVKQGIDASTITKFSSLPLSAATLRGLTDSGFVTPTHIQTDALARALEGKDVLGAAKTGSGKTLAFLIPVIEKLYRERWTRIDGIGAIIISPTRELAMQTFQTLRKIGEKHDLSAGLVIGGTTFEEEACRINQMNVLICTPGRLLQHMDQTPAFDCSNVQILVLDEADRILDLGFEKTMNAIIENLPPRQTLLFSATQTKSVKDLARLSLHEPEYIAVHETATQATPQQLVQAYTVCELHEKLDALYTFIRTHLQNKTLVFLSTSKQVRYVYEMFRRLRPGIPIMPLFGKQKQTKRLAVFKDYSKKPAAVLLATDIAARGLDIPGVDWVVQFDCPEDPATYIHRVGRTARYNHDGKALLLLLPSEKPIVNLLTAKKIPIEEKQINLKSIESIIGKMSAFCAEDPELKYLAQKCFITYMRSVFLQANKEVFNVHALDGQKYAESLGLVVSPKIRFVKKQAKQYGEATASTQKAVPDLSAIKSANTSKGFGDESDSEADEKASHGSDNEGSEGANASEADEQSDDESADDSHEPEVVKPDLAARKRDVKLIDDSDDEGKVKKPQHKTKFDALKAKKNQSIFGQSRDKIRAKDEDAEDPDDMLKPSKTQLHEVLELEDEALQQLPSKPMTATQLRKVPKTIAAVKKAHLASRQRVVFDDDGEGINVDDILAGVDVAAPDAAEKIKKAGKHDIKEAQQQMATEDVRDRQTEKDRIKARKLKQKLKEKEATGRKSRRADADDGDADDGVTLGSADEEDDDDGASFDEDGEYDEYGNRLSDDEAGGAMFDLNEDEPDESDDEAPPPKSKKSQGASKSKIPEPKSRRRRPADDSDDDSDSADAPPASSKKAIGGGKRAKKAATSLEEDEAVARRLLGLE
eukprot:m.797141 g.797141  ORF g.797141 m.797141 type:complete len:894 (-) comp59253_c0_seq5:392-3073(-)